MGVDAPKTERGKFRSVSRRFAYALTAVVTLTLLAFATLLIVSDVTTMNKDLEARSSRMLETAVASLRTPIWNLDYSTISDLVEAFLKDEYLIYMSVAEVDTVINEAIRPMFHDKDFAFFERSPEFIVRHGDIVQLGDRIGVVRLAISRERVQQELMAKIMYTTVVTILMLGSVLLTSMIITRRYISRPLLKLGDSASEIAQGDLTAPIEAASPDEIGRLAQNLQIMRDSIKGLVGALRESNSKLGQYNATLEQRVNERTAELGKAVTEAREARAAAEDANRAKSQLLANMSHELRTPLNAIIGYSEMLQEEVLELDHAELNPDLEKIHSAGQHLLRLINEILDLSKVEAGRMDLFLETFDVRSLIEEVLTLVQPMAENKGNRLDAEYDEGLGTMRTDQTKVRQVLFNLLSNACKFTNDGMVTLAVGREIVNDRSWYRFQVADTGIGMSPAQMENVFQPFAQGDVSTTREYGGTGLGLTITRRFCEMMGGVVTVDSKPGEGSTFIVRLPAEASGAQIEACTTEAVSTSPATASTPLHPAPAKVIPG